MTFLALGLDARGAAKPRFLHAKKKAASCGLAIIKYLLKIPSQ